MSDQLNDFIAAQHQTNIHLAESMTRCQTILEENSRRLFGGDGQEGTLPKIETRLQAVELWKIGTVRWIAGVIAVLTLEGSALALYFQHITSKFPR